MKKHFQPLFLILCVAMMLGGAFYLGFRGATSSPRLGQVPPRRPVQVNFSGEQVASRLIGSSSSETASSSTRSAENETFANALKSCLGRSTEQSMQEHMEIEIETAAVERNLQFENLHFHLRNGTERRLQILPSEGEVETARTSEHLQIRVFGVDAEDLPVPQKIPADVSRLSFARQMHALSEGREPLYSQRREWIKMRENQDLDVEWINGRVQEFQWIGAGFVLSCHQENCVCQKGQRSN